MKVVVTCGPAFEPIDKVRRITNSSTGELGILLANRLALTGCDVTCFKGIGATSPLRIERAELVPFTTNDDLRSRLFELPRREEVVAVFHAAALCDFRIAKILDDRGQVSESGKIPSSTQRLQLVLEPAEKIIAGLRALFPRSRIVGWKYEVEGTRDEAIEKAVLQIHANQTDACIVNGPAYGDGFGCCDASGFVRHIADKPGLCELLAAEVAVMLGQGEQA